MVIWLLGISGAGKSTLGRIIAQKFADVGKLTTMIDGDDFRAFFDNDLGYSTAERRENVKRVIAAAKGANEVGAIVVVCNISPFEDLRRFCRSKLDGYIEIFLEKSLADAAQADVKKVYERSQNVNIVGFDVKFDTPKSPDLLLNVDELTVDESVEKIMELLKDKADE
jgi:adenylylsulfate kinase-like enzyme